MCNDIVDVLKKNGTETGKIITNGYDLTFLNTRSKGGVIPLFANKLKLYFNGLLAFRTSMTFR